MYIEKKNETIPNFVLNVKSANTTNMIAKTATCINNINFQTTKQKYFEIFYI